MLLLLLALACTPADDPGGSANTASTSDGGATADGGGIDGATTDGGGTDGGDTGALGQTYIGPDYSPCVTDAQCEPGSDCTEVPGHRGLYCAPPCEPLGDAAECDLTGTGDMGFETACLETGRCARACDAHVVAEELDGEALSRHEDDTCPDSLECMSVALDDGERTLCAGLRGGAAGFYGVCDHPNIEGNDCPDSSSCFGGSYLGLDDIGVCLPWCDDGSCPSVPDGTTAAPLCYDVGLDHPVCALICIPDSSVCPAAQECLDLGSIGLCAPDGTELPF